MAEGEKSRDIDKVYETVEYYVAYSTLINAARQRGTVTYQELAEALGWPTSGSYMGWLTGGMGGAISYNEHRHGRPMLSAILVNVKGRPSEGFFEFARKLGRLHSADREDEERFWEAEKQAVYETWKKSFKGK